MKKTSALQIVKAALAAADPARGIQGCLSLRGDRLIIKNPGQRKAVRFDLHSFDRVSVFGAGKASAVMAAACEQLLGDRIRRGWVVTKYGHGRQLKKVRVVEAGHPVPDRTGWQGARELSSLLQEAGEKDLIIFLTSGGCSALLPLPAPPVSLKDKQQLTGLLLRSGASIHEINTVRKHISLSKGGWLAQAAWPATVINLVVSDVVGDDLDIIGSGPFVPDPSTFQDAWAAIEKYRLAGELPASVRERLRAGMSGTIAETPKPGAPCFRRVSNYILTDNRQALLAAATRARSLGYKTLLLSSQVQGEVGTLAKFYGAVAKEIHRSGHPVKPPVCLLAGGEPTVTVQGRGLGGRNMELTLALALEIQGLPQTLFLSVGTDGTDGPTDAAGAMADGRTCARALKKGFAPEKYLKENDSYRFFQEAGGLVITGPTGTNVMDIHLLIVERNKVKG